jgi:DNA-binding transcriptional MerR regulator
MVKKVKKKASPAKRPFMRLSQAAAAAGVSKQTVEYYCMLGLVHPIRPPRHQGRFFDAALVKRIALIHQLNTSGYTLRAIRETYLRKR